MKKLSRGMEPLDAGLMDKQDEIVDWINVATKLLDSMERKLVKMKATRGKVGFIKESVVKKK